MIQPLTDEEVLLLEDRAWLEAIRHQLPTEAECSSQGLSFVTQWHVDCEECHRLAVAFIKEWQQSWCLYLMQVSYSDNLVAIYGLEHSMPGLIARAESPQVSQDAWDFGGYY